MKRALCLIRPALVYRRAAFVSGLARAGYTVVDKLIKPDSGDIVVSWNRYGHSAEVAEQFERAGARAVVVENGYLGKSWLGDRWFAMSIGEHAGAGEWKTGSDDRWNSLQVPLAPWRIAGSEIIILAQRGIGSKEVGSPDHWAEKTRNKIGTGRIRSHPGETAPTVSLEEDLADASCVITWASTAALHALLLGIPVWYDFPKWIGAPASRPFFQWRKLGPKMDDEDRLVMFRRLIWAMWRASEIEDGTAFRHLLGA